MIYTLTLNPSVDLLIGIKEVKRGQVNLSDSEYSLPGGKGINVSQVLKNLGSESTAFGFVGGYTGDYIKKALTEKAINHDFIQIKEPTRINIKLKEVSLETEINGSTEGITVHEERVLQKQLSKLENGDILVMAGSIPRGLPKNIYEELMSSLKSGVKVILDTRGESLITALAKKPYLIKPNIHELEEVFGRSLDSNQKIIEAGKELITMGALNVVISMAGDGAYLITRDKVYFTKAPKGSVVNSVGAGDSLVAGMTHELDNGSDIVKAFRRGVATGSGSAFSKYLCTKAESDKLLEDVTVEEVS